MFDKRFTSYRLSFESLHPLVGLAWRGSRLYGVEIFPHDDQWTTDNANLVAFDRMTGARTEVLTGFASLPNDLVAGPDGALYTANWASRSRQTAATGKCCASFHEIAGVHRRRPLRGKTMRE